MRDGVYRAMIYSLHLTQTHTYTQTTQAQFSTMRELRLPGGGGCEGNPSTDPHRPQEEGRTPTTASQQRRRRRRQSSFLLLPCLALLQLCTYAQANLLAPISLGIDLGNHKRYVCVSVCVCCGTPSCHKFSDLQLLWLLNHSHKYTHTHIHVHLQRDRPGTRAWCGRPGE